MRRENAPSRQRPIRRENPHNAPSHSLNAIVASICGWLVWFFSGPIYSLFARSIYVGICNWFYGGEGILAAVRTFFHCTLPGEHVGHFAYNYGELVMGGASFGIAYYITHKLQSIYSRAEKVVHDGVDLIRAELESPSLMAELRDVKTSLEELRQRNNEQEDTGLGKGRVLRSRGRSLSESEALDASTSVTHTLPLRTTLNH